MNHLYRQVIIALVLSIIIVTSGLSQSFPTDDPVIKNIWKEASDSSHLEALAHHLLDVIGPRLTGTPQLAQAQNWVVQTYKGWGTEAKNEEWGKWKGWERGVTHIDLLEPRIRTLEGTVSSWSPGTKKSGITTELIILAESKDSIAFQQWLPSVKGKFVLISQPQLTGRPDTNWAEFALKESFDSLKAHRTQLADAWKQRIRNTGFKFDTLPNILEKAGAAGVLINRWSRGWGTYIVRGCQTSKMPVMNISLEDYNLLFRLVEHSDKPILRIVAESKFLDQVPMVNTFGIIRGKEKPDEYVILSAHLDSWDGASGATDNGTGTILMMEVMRILKKYYPSPKRTIIAGHWNGEEQGMNGSRAFVKDHPEVVAKIQALFNQDDGTGRIISIDAQGLLNAGEHLARWISRIPTQVTQNVQLDLPGMPFSGGSDHAPFIALGAPAFGLNSIGWDISSYTWHTTLDTYDKIVFDEMKSKVILTACLAYLASEDPEFISRERRVMPLDEKTGKPQSWPEIKEPKRTGGIK
jgi:hypothetical protein